MAPSTSNQHPQIKRVKYETLSSKEENIKVESSFGEFFTEVVAMEHNF